MNYIEKLFKQYPFIYFINGEYYALGTGVCAKVNLGSITLKARYERYISALNERITDQEAWKIFHKLIMEADFVKEKEKMYGCERDVFKELNFTETELSELEVQVQQYIEFWKKYNIKNFMC
ncbi:MAG: hypothetical protein IKW30_11970 [Lachnospiraceae bacterium]|nr:hypothetical protein [Lachnospiraceae bacterium]